MRNYGARYEDNTYLPHDSALALPVVALAQAKDQTNSPAANGGRQAIINKLERIRLDTIAYDGLPLSEVVINLRDQAMKRDPEKKGINFMLNPNLAPEAAPTVPPAEDRMATPSTAPSEAGGFGLHSDQDQSAAHRRAAGGRAGRRGQGRGRPIKYSIEDYGVVFSLRGPEPARNEDIGFAFPGGTPRQFLDAVQEQYKVDWSSVADIPKEMADVHIPRLRINQDSARGHAWRQGREELSL